MFILIVSFFDSVLCPTATSNGWKRTKLLARIISSLSHGFFSLIQNIRAITFIASFVKFSGALRQELSNEPNRTTIAQAVAEL